MKIMVGMSGGVDSSVAAALLIENGFDTTGVTLRLYDGEDYNAGKTKTCCSLTDVEDAKAVCYKLGIKHYVFNMKDKFSDAVIDNFVSEYDAGRTPNPCIECNRNIKFGEMLLRAKELGYDKIAMGHYARIEKCNERYLLKKAADSLKDQSYVLYMLTQEQLAAVELPLGGLTKPQVREIADKNGFVNAHKPDSQDICFVPDGDYAAFIRRYSGKDYPTGNYIDENGKVIGRHSGIINYTVGQRKGLGIAVGRPIFVLDKDIAQNSVTLGDEEKLFCKYVLVENTNYIPFDRLENSMRITAKLRYRQKEQPATVYPSEKGAIIEFDEPQRAPSPGQTAVFYDGEIVVGGGTIVCGRNKEV